MKKEKEEVCGWRVIIGVPSGSDQFISVSAKRRRRKNVKRRSKRSGRRRLLRRLVSHSFITHPPALNFLVLQKEEREKLAKMVGILPPFLH